MYMKISVIISFLLDKDCTYNRLTSIAEYYKNIKNSEFIFVQNKRNDDSLSLKNAINFCGHKYYESDNITSSNLAQARNIGLQNASNDICLFLDVKQYMSLKMLDRIIAISHEKGVDKNPSNFMLIPFVTLEKNKFCLLSNIPIENCDNIIDIDIIPNLEQYDPKFSSLNNAILVNRHKFLELGGFDTSYLSDTYSNFDFLFRICKDCVDFEYHNQASKDKKSDNISNFHFDIISLCKLFRDDALKNGILLYGFNNLNDNLTKNIIQQDSLKLANLMDLYKEPSHGPKPLMSNKIKNCKCLVLGEEGSSFAKITRPLSPYIGEFIYKSEWDFVNYGKFDAESLIDCVLKYDIELILMQNPYYFPHTQKLYAYLKKMNFPFLLWDRGSLPDSWLYDPTGFNADSELFAEKCWNMPLTDYEKEEIEDYIQKIKLTDNYLEAQGERELSKVLKRKLGIENKKIVFVPMQVQSDTVIKYFTKPPFDYAGFMGIANEVAQELAEEGWVFVAKKHPLTINELPRSDYPNIIFVPDDANISTLLEMCDVVMLLNSGVGVYAMLYEKPCLVCGQAFYQIKGLNVKISTKNDITTYLRCKDFHIDHDKMLRFIFYLYSKYYCFGNSKYRIVKKKDRIFNLISNIDYYKINLNGIQYLKCKNANKIKLNLQNNILNYNNLVK